MVPSRFTLLCSSLLIALAPAAYLHGQVAVGQELVTLSSREAMHELTLNTQVATSITFPADITLVTGYGLVLDAGHAQELMDSEALAAATLKDLAPKPVTIIHYAQASKDTLVMRAVRPGSPCFVTVRCGTRIFLLKCIAGDKANVAVVIADRGAPGDAGAIEIKKAEIVKQRIAYSSTELLGILSRAKQREFLESVNPDLFDGWAQRRDLALTASNGDITSTITEIQQWPQKDALVFRCRLDNKGNRLFRFKPSDVKVRAGDSAYSVQLADSSGIVRPGMATALDLVVQGNAIGGKEHLSIKNDFRLEVAEDTAPPGDVGPPPNPLLPAVEAPNGGLIPLPEASPPEPMLLPAVPATTSGKEFRHPLPNLYPGK